MGLFSGGTEIINNGELLEGGIPTATIVPWSNASVPSGFLECDGTAVSRSTYAALFAIIGTTYGSGDGSTTFNVPDLQDNVPVGKSPTKNLASTGGANTVAVTASGNIAGSTANASLSTPQLASHSHVTPIPGSPPTFNQKGITPPNIGNPLGAVNFPTTNAGSGGGHSHNMSANFSGNTANPSVLQPYLTVIYIIKT